MKKTGRVIALLLSAGLLTWQPCAAGAVTDPVLTRQAVAERLIIAADDYHPGIAVSDLLKGDETGQLFLNRAVTRLEALLMLERAFGPLPAPAGSNARNAYPVANFNDIPVWAQKELETVWQAGIIAGADGNSLSSAAPVHQNELETLIHRVYTLKGSNLKDDFYATVNKKWLDNATIPDGKMKNGALSGLTFTVTDQIADLIAGIVSEPQQPGTAEARIAALYHSVMDTESREKAGVRPIQTYLDGIENAKNLEELFTVDCQLQRELNFSVLLSYALTPDMKQSNRYITVFSAFEPAMSKEFYSAGTEEQTVAYLEYLTKILHLSGLEEQTAAEKARLILEAEKTLAAAALSPQEKSNVDKIYNLYTPEELAALFPSVRLDALFAATRLQPSGQLLVLDPGALKAAAGFFQETHLDTLKAIARYRLLSSVSVCFQQAFQDASMEFSAVYYGIEGRQTTEQIAAQQVQSLLADDLSRAYVEKYFTAEAKTDVETMIADFIAIYKERIAKQDWMSDNTKKMAIKKLDAMRVKVGYPDKWETYLDNAEIKTPAEGGTFFSNVIAIQKALYEDVLAKQTREIDKSLWMMPPYTVNACYVPTSNEITFPAAILQAPFYDVTANQEENLGGIGYIIAHEITHAFDNNGAKFDENGNIRDWWTTADYAAFQEKCKAVTAWYDGVESAPGIACNGVLTLSENVADLGGASCVTEAASRLEDPDYQTLFRKMAEIWTSTASRKAQQYLAVQDVHAPDKLRCNRVLQTIPAFYTAFDIRPGDGMWTDPDSRVSVW